MVGVYSPTLSPWLAWTSYGLGCWVASGKGSMSLEERHDTQTTLLDQNPGHSSLISKGRERSKRAGKEQVKQTTFNLRPSLHFRASVFLIHRNTTTETGKRREILRSRRLLTEQGQRIYIKDTFKKHQGTSTPTFHKHSKFVRKSTEKTPHQNPLPV